MKCSHGLSICHLGFGYLALLASAPTAAVAAAVAATDTGTAAYPDELLDAFEKLKPKRASVNAEPDGLEVCADEVADGMSARNQEALYGYNMEYDEYGDEYEDEDEDDEWEGDAAGSDDFLARMDAGHEAQTRSDLLAAVDHFRKATRVAPWSFDAHFYLGMALGKRASRLIHGWQRKPLVEDGIRSFRRAIRATKASADTRGGPGLGRRGGAGGDEDGYGPSPGEAVMEPENIPKAHHRLAMLLASVGDYKKAKTAVASCISLDPGNERCKLFMDLLISGTPIV